MEAWDALREEVRSRGFDLPEFDRNGLFYIPRENFSIAHQVSLGGDVSRENVERCIRVLLEHMPTTGESTAAMLARVDRLTGTGSARADR